MHLLLLSLLANAQTPGCEATNFDPCKKEAAIYKEATCEPLQAKNATWYTQCLCLNSINLGNCYFQCTSQAANTEYTAVTKPQITVQCAAANINPTGPLPPPLWTTATVTASSTSSSAALPSSTIGTAKATATTVKSGAEPKMLLNTLLMLSMAACILIVA